MMGWGLGAGQHRLLLQQQASLFLIAANQMEGAPENSATTLRSGVWGLGFSWAGHCKHDTQLLRSVGHGGLVWVWLRVPKSSPSCSWTCGPLAVLTASA